MKVFVYNNVIWYYYTFNIPNNNNNNSIFKHKLFFHKMK